MVRACRPPAREPSRSWLARRSAIATAAPASASSPASIIPAGPPPAITTAWSVMRTTPPGSYGLRLLAAAILRQDLGLAARPPVRYSLTVRGLPSRPARAAGAGPRARPRLYRAAEVQTQAA